MRLHDLILLRLCYLLVVLRRQARLYISTPLLS
jgi:hypothetical protein